MITSLKKNLQLTVSALDLILKHVTSYYENVEEIEPLIFNIKKKLEEVTKLVDDLSRKI